MGDKAVCMTSIKSLRIRARLPELIKRPVQGRPGKQERSQRTRDSIASAAIEVIAKRGIAGLTHRLVAEQAGVSLAATTYYYQNKHDIVAAAGNSIIQRYSDIYVQAACRYRSQTSDSEQFRAFILKVLKNTATVHRSGTTAWAEILLDAVRNPGSLMVSRSWTAHLGELWTDIAKALHLPRPLETARSGIDTTIGLIFMILALGLTPRQIDRVIREGEDPIVVWAPCDEAIATDRAARPDARRKSLETKKRIVDAAIAILIEDGAAAVSFRHIARRTGMAAAAPGYHFPTVGDLLRVAQTELFEESKKRYRSALVEGAPRHTNFEGLLNLTSVVLQREATEYSRRNLATFAIWLEASRRPELRPIIWEAIVDQSAAWNKVLTPLSARHRPVNGVLAQAIYAGKLLRILSLGSVTSDLVPIRRELADDLNDLTAGRFVILPRQPSVETNTDG